ELLAARATDPASCGNRIPPPLAAGSDRSGLAVPLFSWPPEDAPDWRTEESLRYEDARTSTALIRRRPPSTPLDQTCQPPASERVSRHCTAGRSESLLDRASETRQ